MKGIITKSIIILLLISIPGYSYANPTTVQWVEKMADGVWNGTTKVIPALVKTVGAVAGTKWWKVGMGWGSLAVLAGCIGYEGYVALYGEDPIRDWLNSKGLFIEDGTPKQITALGEGNYIPNIDAWNSVASFLANYPGIKVYWFSTYALAAAAQGGNYWCTYGNSMTYINSGTNQANAECVAVTRHNNTHPPGTHTGIGRSDIGYMAFCYPKGSGSVANQGKKEITTAAFEDAAADAWDADNGSTEKAKKAMDKIIDAIVNAINTAPWGDIMSRVNPNTQQTTRQAVNKAVQDAIDGGDEVADEAVGTLAQILKAIVALAKAIANAISELLGLDEGSVNDVPEAETNDEIIGEGVVDDQIDDEKGIMTGFLESVWDSVDGLRDTITGKINTMIGAGGSCSILSTDVYGGTFSIDFCSIDWTAWRYMILAVASIAACLIVMGL